MEQVSAARIVLETISLLLGMGLIVVAWATTRRLAQLDEARLSAAMFLKARLVRRFLLVFAIAVVLFVAMPASILAYTFTDADAFELFHDGTHLMFVVLVLIGSVQLARLTKASQR